MYVTKEDREVIAKTIRAVVEDVYKMPKYYEANDVILSPAQVSEEFPFITQHFLKRYGWCIPRERVDKWDDETCKSKFGYSRNLIIMGKRYDRMLMAEMLSERKRLMEEAEKYYSDKWITGKELTKLYPCFTTSWLRQNGCYLPRTRATIYDDDENEQNSKWGYSLNRIKQYIERGYVEINYKRYYFNEDKTEFRVRAIW